MDTQPRTTRTISPRQMQPQTFRKGNKFHTPYRFEDFQTSQSYLLESNTKKPFKRVNSPGLPQSHSLRKSATKVDVTQKNFLTLGQVNCIEQISPTSKINTIVANIFKPVAIGLVSDRKHQNVIIQESPEQKARAKPKGYYVQKPLNSKYDESQSNLHSFNPQQYFNLVKEDKEVQVTELPDPVRSAPPAMHQQERPMFKSNLQMVEKLETDKLSLEIFMSQSDENQLVFTGISKRKMHSPEQSKRMVLQNLQQLFTSGVNQSDDSNVHDSKGQLNTYIKMESLEQSMFQSYKQSKCDSSTNPMISDYMSISSAQSIHTKGKSSSQMIHHREMNQSQPQLNKKPQWNCSKQPPKKSSKVSQSPFLKKPTPKPSTRVETPKVIPPSPKVVSPRPIKSTQSKQKQIGKSQSIHQLRPIKQSTQVKSFHVTPDKLDDGVYDERFYCQ